MSGFWNTAVRKKSSDRPKWMTAALSLLLVLCLGIFLEFLCLVPAIRAQNSRKETGSLVQTEGGSERILLDPAAVSSDGFELREDGLFMTGEAGFLHIPLTGEYIGDFYYSYEYDGILNASVRVGMVNEYGETRERDARNLTDRNCKVLNTSWIPVNGKADYVDIYISRDGLRESGLSYIDFDALEVKITEFGTSTVPEVNPYRLCMFWCAGILLLLLFFFRRSAAAKIEFGFLILSLTMGTLVSLSLPANKVSWDEEVHFSQVYWMANYRTPVPVSPTILQEFTAGIDTWPYNQPGSENELEALDHYLDTTGDYRNGEHLWSIDLNKTTMTGYVGQAAFVKLGSLLNLPFSDVYKLGRLGNLFGYCILMFLAIRITPVGKAMMAFLGLMPEPILLAGTYSYDPMVTACLYLSFAWLLRVILTPEKKMTWKDFAGIVLIFFWGCRIKAVYAPLILLGLLIPKEKFRSRKELWLMKGGFLALCILMMLSFALPVVIAPRDIGDVRGENTSEKGQMAYILGQPLAYAEILFSNIFRTFPSYIFGEQSLGLLGHQGQMSHPWVLYAGAAAVILTDVDSSCGKRPAGMQKLWMFLLSGAAAVLVWTSMYIAFTTPGNTYIDGVQGRYYLPFLFLVWLAVQPQWIQVKLERNKYHALVLFASGAILLSAYAVDILWKFCM